MKTLVCIKQVPDMESKFVLDGAGTWFAKTDLAWRMNEYDEYAVEQAVQTKEFLQEGDITILCIGPAQVKETMKKGLAMGCDRGVHVIDDEADLKDPCQIAGIIAEFARDKGFDLILTGMQSQDRGSGQVGTLIGEMLDVASVSTVVDFSLVDGEMRLKRELEGGVKACVTVRAPAVVTCQLGLNTPRYPTLPNIMKAKKKELIEIPVAELATVEPRQETEKMYFPEKKGTGLVLEGETGDLADQLLRIIKEKTTVLS